MSLRCLMSDDSVSYLKTKTERGTPPLLSAVKTLLLLEVLSTLEGPVGVSELARLVGSSRGTIHKRLASLASVGFVEQDREGRYRLSLAMAKIGSAALVQAGLDARLQGVLDWLVARTQETATIAALHRDHALIVQRTESRSVLNVAIRVGTSLPLAFNASTLVLQAFAMTAGERAELRASGKLTPSEADIMKVRDEGYALSVNEFIKDVSAVSIPLNDSTLARTVAVTVVGPSSRIDLTFALEALRIARDDLGQHGRVQLSAAM